MTECKYFKNCPTNSDVNASIGKPMSIIEYYTRTYCKENGFDCARFQTKEKLKEEYVPDDLLPDEHERAEKIIKNNIN